jgi:hypothetical protein
MFVSSFEQFIIGKKNSIIKNYFVTFARIFPKGVPNVYQTWFNSWSTQDSKIW